MTDKKQLRRDLRAVRAAFVAGLGDSERTALLDDLRDIVIPRLPAEGVVAAYRAYGDEIDPLPLAQALDARRLAYPHFRDRDAAMGFRLDIGEYDGGPFDIPQPPDHAPEIEPDILLVPLIGADPRCHRLGQGKGHYDRALSALSDRKSFLTIGLAWDVQIVDEVPTDAWDVPLDAIATPTRWIARPA